MNISQSQAAVYGKNASLSTVASYPTLPYPKTTAAMYILHPDLYFQANSHCY